MPIREIGWPRGGEIDIMEFRGNEPNTTTGAIHFYREGCEGSSVECRKYITDSITQADTNLTEEFHVYALEWTEEELVWYLDNTEFMRIKLNDVKAEYNPFSTPFYIILNLAVGGDFLDNPDESTPFPQSLVVDYVRVYQKD
jgi:beta-glucanase (GH16 family)